MIYLKTPEEIEKMRAASVLVSDSDIECLTRGAAKRHLFGAYGTHCESVAGITHKSIKIK